MFGWFKKNSKKDVQQQTPPENYDLYEPKEKEVFRFYNGEKMVRADPLVLYKRLMDKGPELHIDLKVSVSASKDAEVAHKALDRKIREVFNLSPLVDGIDATNTLTETQTVELLTAFITYCGFQKKNMNTSAILPAGTSHPTPPSSGENQPTESSLGSGSAEEGNSIEEPIPLASEPPSPLV